MKVVPDYLEGYLDLERFILLVLLGFGLWISYQSYQMQTERNRVKSRSHTFAQRIPTYQSLRTEILRKRSPETNQNIEENPLSYLEEVVPDNQLTNLQPLNPAEQDYRYQLRIESTTFRDALELLANLEKEPQVSVREFTLVRESFNGLNFHSIIRFQIIV